jgi:hypothetical protein
MLINPRGSVLGAWAPVELRWQAEQLIPLASVGTPDRIGGGPAENDHAALATAVNRKTNFILIYLLLRTR